MGHTRQVIALCSVGNLGKYVCDELIADGRYDFVVITRQKLQLKPDDFFESRKIDRRACDYSTEAVRRTLNETNASVFISFNNADGQQFVDLHCAWLEACRQSKNCKRFIPSEFAGNIEDFPMLPRHYATSRAPFRTILESERKIEWTIVNNAWFMDYLLRDEKTFLPTNSHEFPINPNDWTALIRGSGDEIQSFTSARDVAKALVALLSAPTWPSKTFIAGQWASFNELCHIMEDFYGRKLTKFYRSESDIERDNALPATPENMEKLYMASVEEMMITKAGAMPRDIVARQRKELFGNVHFDSVTEFLVAVGEERARPASLL